MSAATDTPKQTDTAFNAGIAIANLWRQHNAADRDYGAAKTHAARDAASTDMVTLFGQAMDATHRICRMPCETIDDIAAISVACVGLADVANTGAQGAHLAQCLDSILAGTARVAAAASALGACPIADLADEAGVVRIAILAAAA